MMPMARWTAPRWTRYSGQGDGEGGHGGQGVGGRGEGGHGGHGGHGGRGGRGGPIMPPCLHYFQFSPCSSLRGEKQECKENVFLSRKFSKFLVTMAAPAGD